VGAKTIERFVARTVRVYEEEWQGRKTPPNMDCSCDDGICGLRQASIEGAI
jgi:hypothetical protein